MYSKSRKVIIITEDKADDAMIVKEKRQRVYRKVGWHKIKIGILKDKRIRLKDTTLDPINPKLGLKNH